MKNWIIATVAAVMLCACAGKNPPKPHGVPFPINSSVNGGA